MNQFEAPVKMTAVYGGHRGRTVRFDDGQACCTCTYNYSMTDEEKQALARRITAALNATRHIQLDDLEIIAYRLMEAKKSKGGTPK